MLKEGTLYHRIFNQLKSLSDGATADELAFMLMDVTKTVRGRLAEMRKEGLVYPIMVMRKGRLRSVYKANVQVETGFRRDAVEIESVIYVNEAGEYSVKSRIVGGLQTAATDNPQPITVVRHMVTVPKPEETVVKLDDWRIDAASKRSDSIVIDG